MRRIGKAVGNVAAGYASEKDAAERRDAQRVILAVMAEHADATEKEIAKLARARLAKEHGKDDPRLDWATPDAVKRLQKALAVAALARQKDGDD
jgi:hypothetical protein